MRWIDPAGLRRLHILSDCVLVSIGWIAAWGLRYALNEAAGYPINTLGNYLRALPLVVLPWVATGWLFGLYRVRRMNTVVDELQSLFRSAALGALVVASIGFFIRELEISRFVVLAMAFINLGLQGASRVGFHRLERGLRRSGAHDVPAVIVGTGVAAIRLLQKIQDHPEIGYRVAGFLDDDVDAEKDVAGHPVLGGVDELRRVVEETSATPKNRWSRSSRGCAASRDARTPPRPSRNRASRSRARRATRRGVSTGSERPARSSKKPSASSARDTRDPRCSSHPARAESPQA